MEPKAYGQDTETVGVLQTRIAVATILMRLSMIVMAPVAGQEASMVVLGSADLDNAFWSLLHRHVHRVGTTRSPSELALP